MVLRKFYGDTGGYAEADAIHLSGNTFAIERVKQIVSLAPSRTTANMETFDSRRDVKGPISLKFVKRDCEGEPVEGAEEHSVVLVGRTGNTCGLAVCLTVASLSLVRRPSLNTAMESRWGIHATQRV